jgi:hypothetical protein
MPGLRDDAIKLADLRIDGGTQPRVAIDEALVSDYAEAMAAGDKFPPVTVFLDGKNLWLVDGFHRHHAAGRAGLTTLAAEIRQGTRRDAVLYSVGANATHGMRRTSADKRRAVETLLADAEWAQWSDREISRRCGVAHSFVADVDRTFAGSLRPRPILESDSSVKSSAAPASEVCTLKLVPDAPSVRRFTSPKSGKATTMNIANIGRSSMRAVQAISARPDDEGAGADAGADDAISTQTRAAIEAAWLDNPTAEDEAIAEVIGCTANLVRKVLVNARALRTSSLHARVTNFNQAMMSVKFEGMVLAASWGADLPHDPRWGRCVEELTSTIDSLCKVRAELQQAHELHELQGHDVP